MAFKLIDGIIEMIPTAYIIVEQFTTSSIVNPFNIFRYVQNATFTMASHLELPKRMRCQSVLSGNVRHLVALVGLNI